MGTQIINLLIPWITPVIFLLSAQIAVDYGVLGLLGFSMVGILAFVVVYFIQMKFELMNLDEQLKKLIYTLFIMETTICILLVGKILITYISITNIAFFFLTSIIVLYLQKNNKKWVSVSMVISGLMFSFLIPTLVYLKVSIPTVYSGLHFLANEMLRFDNNRTWLLIFILGIILIVHQVLNHAFYYGDRVKSRKAGTFLVSAMIWGIVPISLGSLSFLAKAQAVWPEQSDQVSILVINQFGGQFGQKLFLVTSIYILIGLLTRMWNNLQEKKFLTNLFSGILLIVLLPVVTLFQITLLQVIIFFGLIWGPLLGVALWAVNNRAVNRVVLALGICVAGLFTLIDSIEIGIIAGTVFSILIMKGIQLFKTVYKVKETT